MHAAVDWPQTMPLVSFRVLGSGGKELLHHAQPLADGANLRETIKGILGRLVGHEFVLDKLIIFADRSETPPGTTVDVEPGTLEQLTISEVTDIGKFMQLHEK